MLGFVITSLLTMLFFHNVYSILDPAPALDEKTAKFILAHNCERNVASVVAVETCCNVIYKERSLIAITTRTVLADREQGIISFDCLQPPRAATRDRPAVRKVVRESHYMVCPGDSTIFAELLLIGPADRQRLQLTPQESVLNAYCYGTQMVLQQSRAPAVFRLQNSLRNFWYAQLINEQDSLFYIPNVDLLRFASMVYVRSTYGYTPNNIHDSRIPPSERQRILDLLPREDALYEHGTIEARLSRYRFPVHFPSSQVSRPGPGPSN